MNAHPADWYPDPAGQHEFRYWDGTRWTDDVSNGGIASKAPVGAPMADGLDRADGAMTVGNEGKPETIAKQMAVVGHQPTTAAGMPAGSIFNEPVLVVNQKAKIIELSNQYSVYDQHGQQIAAVNEVGQSKAKKALRLVSGVDQFLTHRLEVSAPGGSVVLRLTRPAKFMKSSVIVSNSHDQEIGRIVQKNMIGKINFRLESGGQELGQIKAQNWRAWNFSIVDAGGNEIATVTKTWEGMAKAMFTTADNYVVQIHQRQAEPLNSLVVAAALSIDTALKQDDN